MVGVGGSSPLGRTKLFKSLAITRKSDGIQATMRP